MERGHEVALDTWRKWREPVEAAGMTFTAAPEYQVFPTPDKPLKPYAAAVRAAREIQPFVHGFAPDIAVADILTPGPALAAELEDVPLATLVPHVHPFVGDGHPIYSIGARLPRTRRWTGALALGQPALRGGLAGDGARPVQRDARAARAGAAAVRPHRAVAGADDGRDAAAARVPAALGAMGAGGRAAAVGAAGRAGRAAAGIRAGRPDRPLDLAGPFALAAPGVSCRPRGRAGARDRDLQRPRAFVADRRARERRAGAMAVVLEDDAAVRRGGACTAATGLWCGLSRPGAPSSPARREAT